MAFTLPTVPTAAAARGLAEAARRGDQAARDSLILGGVPLAMKAASRVARGRQPHDGDDAIGAALEAVVLAVDGFDPERGAWSTYSHSCAMHAALTERRQCDRAHRFHELDALEEPPSRNDDNPGPDPDELQALARALDALPDRHRLVIVRRFGLDDRPPETLAQIGAALGVTKEGARQIERKALDRLHVALAGDSGVVVAKRPQRRIRRRRPA